MTDKFDAHVSELFADAEALLLKKHHDYGPKNISESPGGALNGIRVRLHDKFARINNLIDSGAEPENESLRDSFIDALNYCAIAMLVLDGNWPGADSPTAKPADTAVNNVYLNLEGVAVEDVKAAVSAAWRGVETRRLAR